MPVREHLRKKYRDVFDEAGVERHLRDYLGLDVARELLELVEPRVRPPARLLDVGSGFGSFVLCARRRGYEAFGVEIEELENAFARERIRRELPQLVPGEVYRQGDGRSLPFGAEELDAVTLWNVLEHVADAGRLLEEAVRVLRPGGLLFLICPNYASFRSEAHYQVAWPPLLPRTLAAAYLRLRGRAPGFFESSIHYRTNREVLGLLRRLGMTVLDPRRDKVSNPALIHSEKLRRIVSTLRRIGVGFLLDAFLTATFENPFRRVVLLYARKERGS